MSLSYKTADSDLRGKFALTDDEQTELLGRLIKNGSINGGVVLNTCGRSELYFTMGSDCLDIVISEISDITSLKGMSESHIRGLCLFYEGKKAVNHLFRVSGGLESMILGETEILRQVKEAYARSVKKGFADTEINIVFQGALAYSKKARTETEISSRPVSAGTITANRIFSYIKEKNLKRSVMVIGAEGQIGSAVVKDLLSKGIDVIGTSRLYSETETYKTEKYEENKRNEGNEKKEKNKRNPGSVFRRIHTKRRYEFLSGISALVSATTSPHYLITLEQYSGTVGTGEEKLLVDLAVPADIDKRLAYYGKTKLIGIDDIKEMSERSSAALLDEAQKAEVILEASLDDTLKKIFFKEFSANVDISKKEEWYRKMLFYLKEKLTADEFKAILDSLS